MTMQVLIDSAWIVDCPLGESWYVIDDGALEEEGTAVCTHLTAPRPTDARWY
jgi:hypothetical protein